MKIKRIGTKLLTLALCLILGGGVILSAFPLKTSAEGSTYTNVLEDLRKDSSFNPEDYPAKADDYSLQVIQIAESAKDELFIYVYQPSDAAKELVASEIRLSELKPNEEALWHDYDLKLVSTSGVFDKYLVENFKVNSSSAVRFYEIVCLFRAWDKEIDEPAEGGSTITLAPVEVAQKWTVQELNGELYYSMEATKVLTITDKFVGFIRYEDGLIWYEQTLDACDSYFIAFSCNYDIEDLIEATVVYKTQTNKNTTYLGSTSSTFGEISPKKEETLLKTDQGFHETQGFGGQYYTWQRISTSADFLKNITTELIHEGAIFNVHSAVKIDDTDYKLIENKQWVLQFKEFAYSRTYTGDVLYEAKTLVSDVSILRLKFVMDEDVYNLGVIDDKQTPSTKPSGITQVTDVELGGGPKKVLAIFLLIILVVVIFILRKPLKILLQILLYPFELIVKLFRKNKNK